MATGERERQALFPFPVARRPPDPTPATDQDPYGDPEPEWLNIEWRRHLHHIEIEGARVNYVDMGEGGNSIVFVHGLAGCWQNWLENIPHFARQHRVVALDLPGFGSSPMPPWEISIPNYGRLLNDFCGALNLHESALVGNSMGGFIAAEVAIAEPDWVDRLVLVSAAGISHARMRREPAEVLARMTAAATPLILRIRKRGMRRWRLRYAMFRNLFHAPHRLRPELLWEFFDGAVGSEGFIPASIELIGYDFHDRLERIKVPTLIVWGRNDHVIPAGDALEYERLLSDSRLEIFDRCGHLPQAERPVRFNRLLEGFLAE